MSALQTEAARQYTNDPYDEYWAKDGRTLCVEVDDHETVMVSVEFLHWMLTELGFTQEH